MTEKKNTSPKKNVSRNINIAACAWLLMVVILLAFFLMNRKTIVTNWGIFSKRVFAPKGAVNEILTEEEVKEITKSEANEIVINTHPASDGGNLNFTEGLVDNFEATNENIDNTAAESTSSPENLNDNLAKNESSVGTSGLSVPEIQVPMLNTELCFMSIDADGNVSRRVITRPLPKSTAPLTAALKALLAGPTDSERNSENCVSFIPANTQLIGASIKNGVAYLNFSEEFEINTLGVEGYTAQLMQIVYTATSFPTVSSVQFLIAGEKRDYLGSEGLWIGSAFSRASFR